MTYAPFDFTDSQAALEPIAEPHAAPVVPPLDLQAVEQAFLARRERDKAFEALREFGRTGGRFTSEPGAVGLGAALALCPIFLIIGLIGYAAFGPPALLPLMTLVLLTSVGGVKLLHLSRRLEAAHFALALSTATPQWISPCISALDSGDSRQSEIAANLLIRLLPVAPPLLLRKLTAAQRDRLYTHLTSALRSHPEFALAILQGIERAKDVSAAPYLELAIPRFALTPKIRQMRQAAIQCGEFLDALEAQERERLEQQAAAHSPNEIAPEQTKEERAESRRVQGLLDALQKEARRLRRPGMRVGFLAATWLIIFPYCALQFLQSLPGGWHQWPVWLWGLATLASAQSHRFTLFGRQSETARKLAQCDSPRAVGSLVEALEWPDEQIQRVASDALIRLLPRLKASDAGLLNSKQRAILYKVLRPMNANRQSKLICAILGALEQVGDKAAVPAVSRLETLLAITTAQRSVRAAAKRCLPYLNANAENARSSQTLLRASSAITTTPDMLLRPAASGPATPPEQMLRASGADPNAD